VTADATLAANVPTIVTPATGAGLTLSLPATSTVGDLIIVSQMFPVKGPVYLTVPSTKSLNGEANITLTLHQLYPGTPGTLTLLCTVTDTTWVVIAGRFNS